jgi:transcriptional regulator with XRE-family HTH domain
MTTAPTIQAAADGLRQRIALAITQGDTTAAQLARTSGIGQSHLSNWLHCKRSLSIATLDRIAVAAKCPGIGGALTPTYPEPLFIAMQAGRGLWMCDAHGAILRAPSLEKLWEQLRQREQQPNMLVRAPR